MRPGIICFRVVAALDTEVPTTPPDHLVEDGLVDSLIAHDPVSNGQGRLGLYSWCSILKGNSLLSSRSGDWFRRGISLGDV